MKACSFKNGGWKAIRRRTRLQWAPVKARCRLEAAESVGEGPRGGDGWLSRMQLAYLLRDLGGSGRSVASPIGRAAHVNGWVTLRTTRRDSTVSPEPLGTSWEGIQRHSRGDDHRRRRIVRSSSVVRCARRMAGRYVVPRKQNKTPFAYFDAPNRCRTAYERVFSKSRTRQFWQTVYFLLSF